MTDSILILGGGVAGLTAASACVDAGAHAIVVEKGPIIGGRLAPAMTGDSPAAGSVVIPSLGALARMDDLEVVTLAELEGIEGRPGNFKVSIRERARFVTDACTRCSRCRPVCPSVRSNEYDQGLTYRKAIFTPLPQTFPQEYAIDIDACLNSPPNYLPCNRCIEVCDDDAIHFDLPLDQVHLRDVAAVILSVGFEIADANPLRQSGYGAHPDVLTSAELERLLMAPGPTGGFAAKPSNEEYPDSVLLILDELTPFSVYTAVTQIHRLLDQDIGEVTLLLTEQPASRQSSLLQAIPDGVAVVSGLLQKIEPGSDGRITVSYADFSGSTVPRRDFELVVLGSDIRPAASTARIAQILQCNLTSDGYIATGEGSCLTSQPGIFVAGGARGPTILPDAVAEARTAATAALAHLDPRLLRPDRRPSAAEKAVTGDGGAPSNDELRARIERALLALLNKQ